MAASTNIGLRTVHSSAPRNMGWEGAMFRNEPGHCDTMMNRQFDTQTVESSINQYPAFILADDKLLTQNRDLFSINLDHSLLVVNNDPAGCGQEPFNVRNQMDSAGALQAGYARNIDLDSELKRINHIDDKCFYDNYKRHPAAPDSVASAPNGLYCHRRAIVNDYSTVNPYIGNMGTQDKRQPSQWFSKEGHNKQRPVFQGRYHHINDPSRCFEMASSPTAKWERAYGTKNDGDSSGMYLAGNPQVEAGGEKVFHNVTNRSTMNGPRGYHRSMPC